MSLVLAICAFPIIGSIAPRALSFLPAAVGVLGYGAHYYIYKIRPPISRPALYITAATLVLALISCVWSIDPEQSLERCTKMLPVLLGGVLLLSLVQAQSERFYQIFPKIFMIAMLITAGLNAFEMLTSGLIHNLLRGEGYAFTKNLSPLNRNVVVMTLCLFPALMLSFQQKNYKVFGALAVFAGIVYYMTDSQSAHLAFLVGMLMMVLFPAGKKWAWHGLLAIIAALLLATPWLTQFMFASLPSLIEDIHWFATSYAPHRMEIWDFVSRYALQNPLYGFGIEATKMVQEFDTQMLYHEAKDILHPHNFAVQFWMEFGVIGPLFLIGVFAYLFRLMSALPVKAQKLSITILLGFVSTAATGYGFWQGWLLGAIVMIAVYGVVVARCLDDLEASEQQQSE